MASPATSESIPIASEADIRAACEALAAIEQPDNLRAVQQMRAVRVSLQADLNRAMKIAGFFGA